MYDPEDLLDWAKDLIREGERHLERNLEEAGYPPEDIQIILNRVNEFINGYDLWEDDYDDDDYIKEGD